MRAFTAPVVFVGLILLGVVVNLVALLIKVADVEWVIEPGQEKQVGFALAPNWGLTSFLLMPAAVGLVLLGIESFRGAVDKMLDRGMLRTTGYRRVTARSESVKKLSQSIHRWSIWCGLVIFIFVFVAMAFDYYDVSAKHLLAKEPCTDVNDLTKYPLSDPYLERDWSIAACLNTTDGSNPGRVVNAIYTGIAYFIYPTILTAFVIWSFVFVFFIGAFFRERALSEQKLLLIPDLTTKDSRRGFESLEPLYTNFCLLSLVSILILYSMILQNVFLRLEDVDNIWDLIKSGYAHALGAAAILQGGEDILTVLSEEVGFYFAANDFNVQAFIGVILMGCLILLLYAGCIRMLLTAARQSGEQLRQAIQTGKFDTEAELGLSSDDAIKRLDEMDVWPVRWISLRTLLFVVAVSAVSLVAVNVGLYLFGIVLLIGAYTIIRRLFGWGGLTPEAKGGAEAGGG
jgi:hypothetical protein